MSASSFKSGIHPKEHKEFTEKSPLKVLPAPKEVFLPLQQHIGSPCQPVVKPKDEIKAGQVIAEASGFVSSRIYSTISGKVKDITWFQHPLGAPCKMIHIVGDGKDEWSEDLELKINNWQEAEPAKLIESIKQAGIVGMGGAAFPTHVKLSPPKDKKIDTILINGCECEPWLTADHRMMVECSNGLLLGTRILMKALGIDQACIGIETNTPDAIEAMKKATAEYDNIRVIPLKTKYPQGAEKMLIKAAVNREVPAGKLPMEVGVVVTNVATSIAVAEAIVKGRPLVERVVTVTGDSVISPGNVVARIGTPFKDLIAACGGLKEDVSQIIMGGPMMGINQYSLNVPVVKATSGILCLSERTPADEVESPCIKCGACVTNCPTQLVPTRLVALIKQGKFDEAEKEGILNCFECGCCSWSCPAKIQLVQWLKIGKFQVGTALRKRQAKEQN